MNNWLKMLQFDPIPPLLNKNIPAIEYFTRRDILEEKVNEITTIWQLPLVQKIVKQQQPNGSWKSRSKNRSKHPAVNYDLTETWKQFRYLIDQYEMNNSDSVIEKAAEFIFSCQTEEGDIRGMLGNQYAAYYSGALLGLLIKSGYESDPRIERGLQWLLSVRQNDGGWLASALMASDYSWKEITRLTSKNVETIPYQNLSRPSSHNWTGMVIRAFAAHPKYRKSVETKQAAELLKNKFFQRDPHYSSYQDAGYWVKFQYPYWWNHLVAALDSISLIGLSSDDKEIKNALNWIQSNQQNNGLWLLSYSKKHQMKYNTKAIEMQAWVSLAICRIFKRFFP
jgi:hypothetical protein